MTTDRNDDHARETEQTTTVRVVIPYHLRNLARVTGEVELDVAGDVTQASILDALEERYPVLRGTIRDQKTKKRRAFIRFFACNEDHSHDDPHAPVPAAVLDRSEPFMVIGAMAGG